MDVLPTPVSALEAPPTTMSPTRRHESFPEVARRASVTFSAAAFVLIAAVLPMVGWVASMSLTYFGNYAPMLVSPFIPFVCFVFRLLALRSGALRSARGWGIAGTIAAVAFAAFELVAAFLAGLLESGLWMTASLVAAMLFVVAALVGLVASLRNH